MNKNKHEILQEVLNIAEECNSIIDAIITVCDKYNVEVETIAHYIKYSKDIKEKVKQEGLDLKMLVE